MKILNRGRRAYLVKAESVLEGGELSNDKQFKSINQGETVVVTPECGKMLRTYSDISVLEEDKKTKGK